MELVNGRYKILHYVDKDFYATSYIAMDLYNHNEKILIKIFEPEFSKSALIQHYIDEYIYFTSFEHETLLQSKSFDIIQTIDNKTPSTTQFFYTREYVPYNPIKYTDLSQQEAMEVFVKICSGINYLHFRGICYKYLNLDNIVLYKENNQIQVKLKDLAYVKQIEFDRGKIAHYNQQFIAPECQLGLEVDFRSDIFSLGVLLFYLYYGASYKNNEFKYLYDNLKNNRNEKLDKMIKEMTSFEVDERYRNIGQVISAVRELGEGEFMPIEDRGNYERLNFNIKLVNRENEINRVRKAFNDFNKANMGARAILVKGEAGIGKSRFIKEVLYRFRMDNVHAYFSEYLEPNAVQYKALKEILKQMLKNVNYDLIKKYGPELVKVIPSIGNIWDIKPSPVLPGQKEKLRLYDRVFHFIHDSVSLKPAVMILENIHLADESTLEFISFVLKNKKKFPVLFVMTCRREEQDRIAGFLKEWETTEKISQIHLSKFNLEETATLIQNVLSMAWKPLKLATRIMKLTDGNPRYIEEVIKNLFIEGTLVVSQDNKWMIKGEGIGIDNVKLPSTIGEALLNQVKSLDENTLHVLKTISIFNAPVSAEILGNMMDMDLSEVKDILYKLVEMKILGEKLEDWGYTYDYENHQLKNHIYRTIAKEEKAKRHGKAAMILEISYDREGRENKDELIHHLTKCGNISRAIDYCLESAQKMFSLNIYTQSLDFLEKIIELFGHCEEDHRKTTALLIMGEIYFNMGETDKSLYYYEEAVKIAEKFHQKREMVDGKNKISSIYLVKNMIESAEKMISEIIKIAQEIEYIDGYLEAGHLLSRTFFEQEDLENASRITDEFLKKSISFGNYRYIGSFLNLKGNLLGFSGKYDEAMLSYIKSIEYLEKSGCHIETMKPINNIGVLFMEAMQNTKMARKYYEKALKLAEKYNLIAGTSIYYLNIGETYLVEDEYQLAIEYLNKAIHLDELTGDKISLSWAYLYLSEAYMKLNEYTKAYNYLKKAEGEMGNHPEASRMNVYYYIMKVNFYFQIGSEKLANQWLSQGEALFSQADKINEFEIYSLKLLSQLDHMKNEGVQNILALIEKFQREGFVKEKRRLLLDAALYFVEEGLLHEAAEMLQYDEKLSDVFDSKMLQYKRNYILGYFAEDKIRYFENMLQEVSQMELLELEWRIHQILGDAFFKEKEYYKAINSYIFSLDILRRLTNKIPNDLRLDYMNSSKIKKAIKQKILILKEMILEENHGEDSSQESNFSMEIEDLNAYFDFSDLQRLFHNEKFLESALREYESLLPMKIASLRDLIQFLSSDHGENLEIVLKYCVKISLATRGFIILVDEGGNIKDTMKLYKHHKLPDIRYILERVSQKQDGILIKENFSTGLKSDYRYLPDNAKAVICIPITAKHKMGNMTAPGKRKNWGKDEADCILGYLYLDTNKIFNNFDWSAYKTCDALCNLLYVLIENYHLKVTSSIDKLTNVFIRKYIEKTFNNELIKAEINNSQLSIVMCDIDKFKFVNDFYGHRKGDDVLRQVAEILRYNVREGDLVGRYGGEEFILILPRTNLTEARTVCERLRKTIEDTRLLGDDHAVTMSFGIAAYPDHGNTQEELIEKADQALYHAKETGRNKSVIWDKNIGSNRKRVDKLAGIISGNIAQDHRNVQVIVEIIELLKERKGKREKIFEILGRLIEIIEAKQGILIELAEDQIKHIYCRERFKEEWIENVKINEKLITHVLETKAGDYLIDWESIQDVDAFTGTPDWQSLIILPIINQGKIKGVLQLNVPIKEKEFDFKTFNFVNSITGVIGAVFYENE